MNVIHILQIGQPHADESPVHATFVPADSILLIYKILVSWCPEENVMHMMVGVMVGPANSP